MKKGKKIWVGDLGETIITNNEKDIPVYFVKEEDGTKSWQLLPDVHSDTIIKMAYVKPKEKLKDVV